MPQIDSRRCTLVEAVYVPAGAKVPNQALHLHRTRFPVLARSSGPPAAGPRFLFRLLSQGLRPQPKNDSDSSERISAP